MLFQFIILFFIPLVRTASDWINYPANGTATMTHYTMAQGYIASCGCTGDSTKYPTAAMSQMAYGSSTAYGPACGKCFKLTLLNTYTPDPPFFPAVSKSVIVKVTDLCPYLKDGWCGGMVDKTNPGGQYINFDLVWPSSAIPNDFFPSNVSFYGYSDFGVWNVSYQTVDCLEDWAGRQQQSALGSVASLGDSGCCPANPGPNSTCPSFSDDNAIPPNTATSLGHKLTVPIVLLTVLVAVLVV